MVKNGPYRCLPVHPTQLYSSLNAACLCLILYLVWRRAKSLRRARETGRFLAKPGCTFALMFVLYGMTRFFIEFLRDDNPLGFWGLTISQRLSLVLIIFGAGLIVIFTKARPPKIPANSPG